MTSSEREFDALAAEVFEGGPSGPERDAEIDSVRPRKKSRTSGVDVDAPAPDGPQTVEDIMKFAEVVVARLDSAGVKFAALQDKSVVFTSKWCGGGTATTAFLFVVDAIAKQHGWHVDFSLHSMCDIIPRARQLLQCYEPSHLHKDLLEPFDQELVKKFRIKQSILLK